MKLFSIPMGYEDDTGFHYGPEPRTISSLIHYPPADCGGRAAAGTNVGCASNSSGAPGLRKFCNRDGTLTADGRGSTQIKQTQPTKMKNEFEPVSRDWLHPAIARPTPRDLGLAILIGFLLGLEVSILFAI